jgi:CheY-like chemotaxis protein
VLIVEDHADTAESLALILELAGHQVTIAPDGGAGLTAARRVHPEVVLCDIGLPGGISGYEVAQAFRADPELASSQLIALTGHGLEEEHVRAMEAGFDLHVTKPIEVAALQALLADLPVRKKRPPAE